jgi:hypothetical protein
VAEMAIRRIRSRKKMFQVFYEIERAIVEKMK